VIIGFVPSILWILLIYVILKKLKGMDLLTFLKTKIHPSIYYVTTISFATFLMINAFITFRTTVFWSYENYTFDVPLFVMNLILALICLYGSIKGIHSIGMMALLLLPFVMFLGFLVGIGNVPNKNYTLLFPVFQEDRYSILKVALYSSIGSLETLLLLFVVPFGKKVLRLRWLFLIMFFLSMMTLGPLIGAIAEFNIKTASNMTIPAYDQWRLLSFGKYINRLDFFSIFQWLAGAYIRISLSVFFAHYLLFGMRKKWMLSVFYGVLLVSNFMPLNTVRFSLLLNQFYYPSALLFLIGFLFLFLVLTIFKMRGKKDDKKELSN
jgi:spore germination protein KB